MSATTELTTQLVVLGSGPGGYTAAFRAADLGLKVVLVERYSALGGACLNVGCIPSKALLHVAKVIDETEAMSQHGVEFGKPTLDINKIRGWKESIVNRLTGGLSMLAKQRKVTVVNGTGQFIGTHTLEVVDDKGAKTTIKFDNAIIAAGSRPVALPFLPKDPRIIDSTGALEMEDVPKELLVIGGGIIGMEMATVYSSLGSHISVVELMDTLLPGVDKDISSPLHKWVKKRYSAIMLKTKVTKVEAKKDGLWVTFEGEEAPKEPKRFDKVLCAVGRIPNGKMIGAEKAGVNVDEKGFISVDNQMRTNIKHIFAIGDICGNPMLAHKAIPEGRVAAEVISGMKHYFDPRCIPSVCYTDPEVAWTGVTETEAKAQKMNYGVGIFPWAASGRSLSLGRSEGITKVLFDKDTHRVIGAAMVGPQAGDLIAEVSLAIEMGCDAEDIALTIHPHPTLSETIAMAAEAFEGTITDLYMPKKQ